jgi:hypothetical protein
MSQFIGNALPTTIIERKDRRLVPTYQVIRRERDRINDRDLPTGFPGGYTSSFWPGNRGFVCDQSEGCLLSAIYSRPVARLAWGQGSRVGFVGRTYDANGNVLGGVTCSLFRTSDRLWIMDVVSDAVDGSFLLQSWYSPDTHFIVFSKAGSPEVFGTTRQTLVGA